MAYHTNAYKVQLFDGQVAPLEAVAAVLGFLVLCVAALHRSFDEIGMGLVMGAVCAFRRYRIVPIVQSLATDQSYVGWEKYAKEYLGNVCPCAVLPVHTTTVPPLAH